MVRLSRTPHPSGAISHAVYRVVARALGLDSLMPSEEEALALDARLAAPELSDAELGALVRAPTGGERVDHVVGARIRGVLAATTREAATRRGLAQPSILPSAIFVRGRADATTTLATIREDAALDGASPEAGPRATLLVADDDAHATLLDGAGREASQVSEVDAGAVVVRGGSALESIRKGVREAIAAAEASGRIGAGDPLLGSKLGPYRIEKHIGTGGFGTVYLARHEAIGSLFAIKVLNEDLACSQRDLGSFLDEARILVQLDHENIVSWHGFEPIGDGRYYLVMEFVEGAALGEILGSHGTLKPRRATALLLQIAKALHAAHTHPRREVLHLDLTPRNVLVVPARRRAPEKVKVIDFGISYRIRARDGAPPSEEPEAAPTAAPAPSAADAATRPVPGAVQRARGGSPQCAAPEHCAHLAGEKEIVELDARADIYSLGVIGFRMLTGRYPVEGIRSARDALRIHGSSVAVPKTAKAGAHVPRRLGSFVDRCLQKDREQRWHDAEAACRELEKIARPRPWYAFGAAIALAGLALRGVIGGPDTVVRTALEVVAHETGRTVVDDLTVHEGIPEVVSLTPWEPPRDGGVPEPVLVLPNSREPLRGWSVVWDDPREGRLAISAVPGAGGDSTTAACLYLRDSDDDVVRSRQFRLQRVPAWSIGEPTIARHDRALELDPTERSLTIDVEGAPGSLMQSARLVLPDGESIAGTTSRDAADRFSFALGSLAALPRGPVELAIRVKDHSGHEESATYSVALCGTRAKFEDPQFLYAGEPASPVQGAHRIAPGVSAIRVRVTRPARLLATVDGADELPAPVDIGEALVVDVPIEQLGLTKERPRFDGRIVLRLEDDAYVDGPPLDEQRILDVAFEPRVPTLSVEGDGEKALRTDRRNDLVVPPDGTLRLSVHQSTQLPLHVRGSLERVGGAGTPIECAKLLANERIVVFEFAPVEAGAHRLSLDGTVGERRFAEPFVAELFLDATPPVVRVALEPPTLDWREARVASNRLAIRLEARDAAPLQRSSLALELIHPGGRVETVPTERWLGPGDADQTELSVRADWPALFPGEMLADGLYTLRLSARNAAGLPGLGETSWLLDRLPPDVRWVSPRAVSDRWPLTAKWELQVRADDPNGIRRVEATAVRIDAEGAEEFRLELGELVALEGGIYLLAPERQLPIDVDWSGKRTAFLVRAWDSGGVMGLTRVEPAEMGQITPILPACVVARADADDRMVLVRENATDYVACGRPARDVEDEIDLLGLSISARSIAPFYLDVHEVTRKQFRAFVDSGGYDDARNWTAGHASRVERGQRLRELAGDDYLPVTGVSLAEASAYARHRGKRLPTLLEWEYVVRGGTAYRTSTVAGHDDELALGPRAVGRGVDFVQLSGTDLRVWDLVSNASEWTWSPDLGPLTAEQLLVATPPGAEPYYWTVGGSWTWKRFGYLAKRSRIASKHHPDVGFRCALDAGTRVDMERYDVCRE